MPFLRILVLFLPLLSVAQTTLVSSDLPIVSINTNGQSIGLETKITAQMQVRYKGPGQRNFLSDAPSDYNGLIGIERRGSSSDFFSDKKPYAVELRDAAGEDLDYPLLGMPEDSDWAFMAPYSDKTLVRDALMLELARKTMAWAPRTRFVELLLNGEYVGVYMIAEKIKRGKNRVDVSKLKQTDISGDQLTGGYILKIDKTTGDPDFAWSSSYPPYPGATGRTLWQLSYPKLEDVRAQQQLYITDWINDFETMMAGSNFADTTTGYPKYLDLTSFVDFILFNELSKNVDGYRLSTFFYKDRDSIDSRLHAGPIWDFNIALGNVNYCGGDQTSGWAINFNSICGGDQWAIQFWWQKLWQHQPFRKLIRDRWFSLRTGTLSNVSIMNSLDSLNNVVKESQVRNFQRWPILNYYVWPNAYCCGTFNQHNTALRNWILQRLVWMDANMKTLYVGEYHSDEQFQTYPSPNPSSGEIKFNMYLRHNDLVYIRIYDVLGHFLQELVYNPEFNGENELIWNNSLRPGVYLYEVRVNDKREATGKLVVDY
jgi:hypothetical protein